jgi:hypothetical protein
MDGAKRPDLARTTRRQSKLQAENRRLRAECATAQTEHTQPMAILDELRALIEVLKHVNPPEKWESLPRTSGPTRSCPATPWPRRPR